MAWNQPEPGPPPDAERWFTPGRFAALLAVLIGATYPEVLFGQGTFFHRDFAIFGYPLAFYQKESFWRGELPLWNPLNYCGVPFLAQWNTLVLYPLSLLYLLLPLSWSLGIFCLVHLFGAGMGMYFLAHRWTGNRFAAAAAGLAYSFNALMLNSLMWPNNIAALGWLPWVVLAVQRAWRDGRRWLLLAGLAGAMQMLAGAPEVILLTWVLLASLFAGEMVRAHANRVRMAARFLTVGLWVTGVAAAQLLPFLDLLAHSQRDKGFVGSMWAMPAWGWANFLVPLYRNYLTSLGAYIQPDQYWIPSYYLGVGVFALALLAVGLVRRRLVWLLGALTALCLLLALGDKALVYSVLRKALPGLGLMRYPIKLVILPAVLLPLLAAIFLAHCPTVTALDWPRQRRRIAGLGFALLAIIGLLIWCAYRYPLHGTSALVAAQSGAIRAGFLIMILAGAVALRQIRRQPLANLARVALLLLLWLDVLTAGPRPNPSVPRWVYEPNLARTELHLDPEPKVGESRTLLNAEAEDSLSVGPMTNGVNEVLYSRLGFYCDANLLDHVPKVIGMYSLYQRETGDYLPTLFRASQPPDGLADFLAVSHINRPGKVNHWEFRPTHLPWVTTGQQPIFLDPTNTLAALTRADFNPRTTVFLRPEDRARVSVTGRSAAKIISSNWGPQRITLVTEAAEPALVVISQAFYHNWRAYVDDRPTPLLRANYAFQALQVPAGRRQVTLVYEDHAFYCGALISLVSAVACVVIWRRGRQHPAG